MSATVPPSQRFGSELRSTATLAAPLVAGHLSTALISFVDSVLAGRHGTSTLAAVTIGTAIWWLPMMLPIGALLALPASVSQLDGAGRRDEIGALFRQALWLALGLGVLLFGLQSVIGYTLAPIGIAPEIIPGARAFLDGIRWGAGAGPVLLHALPQ